MLIEKTRKNKLPKRHFCDVVAFIGHRQCSWEEQQSFITETPTASAGHEADNPGGTSTGMEHQGMRKEEDTVGRNQQTEPSLEQKR